MALQVFLSGSPVRVTGSTLANQNPTFTVDLRMYGSTATSGPWETLTGRTIWVADAPCQVVGVVERHNIVGSTTGMLVKASNGGTIASGLNVLSAVIDHTAAVDTALYGAVIASTARNQLAQGDALGWRWTTAGNNAPQGMVVVTLQYI